MSKTLKIFRQANPVAIEPFGDARFKELEKALCIDPGFLRNLVSSDLKEIAARQESIMWLHENFPDIEELAKVLHTANSSALTFPKLGPDFINYADALEAKKTAFWLKVDAFKDALDGLGLLPVRLQQIFDELSKNEGIFLEKERKITREEMSDLRKVFAIEGILQFKVGISSWSSWRNPINLEFDDEDGIKETTEIKDLFCFGAAKYSETLDDPFGPWVAPKYLGPLGKKLFGWINRRRMKKRLEKCRIRKAPGVVIRDIGNYLNKWLLKNTSYAKDLNGLTLQFAYWFNERGLHIQLINWEASYSLSKDDHIKESSVFSPDFGDAADRKAHKSYSAKFSENVNASKENSGLTRVIHWLSTQSFCHDSVIIEAPETLEKYATTYITGIKMKYEKRMDEILDWQKEISKAFNDIRFVTHVLGIIKNLNMPHCFPELASEGNLFWAEGMSPVRVNHLCDIKPFGELSVNGQIVNLTGQNGSGKSTAMLSVFDLFMMAQAGFPVAASSAKISIKENFLLSFLDRQTEESTFKAKLKKDAAIAIFLNNLPEEDRERTLVIIDELGTATTQESVMPVVEQYINWLAGQKVSVIMSTQIPDLSKYVGEELQGLNYVITSDYNFEPGIGEGEPEKVAREMGFFELLKDTKK
jgi:hypothetical protein